MARMAPMAEVSLKQKTAVKSLVRERRSHRRIAEDGGPDVFPEEAAELGMENDADLARDAGDGLPACLGVEGVALAFHRGNAAVPQVAEVAKRHAGCYVVIKHYVGDALVCWCERRCRRPG